jgi:hypothetical protein
MAEYRARIVGSKAAANGDVHLDCFVEREIEEDVWELIPNGHRCLVLDGVAVLMITESSMTNAQKRQALANLFRQEVKSWGLDQSDDANVSLEALVSWPQNVSLAED